MKNFIYYTEFGITVPLLPVSCIANDPNFKPLPL